MHVAASRTFAAVLLMIMLGLAAVRAQSPAAATDSNGVKPPAAAVPVAAPPSSSTKDPQFMKRRGGPITPSDLEYERQKALARERVERMRKDAARILQEATELKEYVDKTNEHVLSLEVIRKAEKMEKLARDLKNSMKAE